MKAARRQSHSQYRDITGKNRVQGSLQLCEPVSPLNQETNYLALSVDSPVCAPGPSHSGSLT
jgi:hypothetical protein